MTSFIFSRLIQVSYSFGVTKSTSSTLIRGLDLFLSTSHTKGQCFRKRSAFRLFSQSSTDSDKKHKSGWRIINDWTTAPDESTVENNNINSNNNNINKSLSSIADYSDLKPTFSTSPVEKCMVRDRIFYLKRDDLLRLPHSNISGNKARKMYALNSLPLNLFPKVTVSYGGPQSNAMLALSAIVHSKNMQIRDQFNNMKKDSNENDNENKDTNQFQFLYYTKKLPRWLRKTPSGNFLRATSLGMQIVELSPTDYNQLFGGQDGGSTEPPPDLHLPTWALGDALWVPQGGATGVAIPGVNNLAKEIYSFWNSQNQSTSQSALQTNPIQRKLAVCLPAGTGTTGLFLQRSLHRLNQ